MKIFLYAIIAIFGYIIGSLNSAIVVSRFYKTNIKEKGSKNAGLTNVQRVLGNKAALFVLILDLLKGVLSTGLGYLLIKEDASGALTGGVFTVLGHIFPVFFSFKGGKGILISFSVILMTDWRIALICLGCFILIVLFTKYVSLGSIVSIIIAFGLTFVFKHDIFFSGAIAVLMIVTVVKHKDNIKRLLSGKENKLSFKKKGDHE